MDSNHRSTDYESGALTPELPPRGQLIKLSATIKASPNAFTPNRWGVEAMEAMAVYAPPSHIYATWF